MHKGFKCLDSSTGRVYISRDVVFDETLFPFAHLHPNAGARLRQEILLLPDHLIPAGDVQIADQTVANNNQPSPSDVCVQEQTATGVESIEDPSARSDADLLPLQHVDPDADSLPAPAPQVLPIPSAAASLSPTRGGGGSDRVTTRWRDLLSFCWWILYTNDGISCAKKI